MNILTHRTCWVHTIAAAIALVVGCNQSEPPAFRLNMVEMVSQETSAEYQQEIANVLGALFGTPDEPVALEETGLDANKLARSAGPAWSDEKGVQRGLYRKHCVHCHGISGDGRGPTSRFLNPYPRDYRQGVFKFKGTYNADRPTAQDLHMILNNGIPGTAMPAFSLLPNSEVESLVEYVKYLSFRGQLETSLISFVYDELGEDDEGNHIPLDPASDPEQRDVVLELLAEIVEEWNAAEQRMISPDEGQIPGDDRTPDEIAASVANGLQLYHGKRANCYTCHGPTSLGDGQQNDWDVWQKAHQKFLEETIRLAKSIQERSGRTDLDESSEARLDEDKQTLAERQDVVDTLYPIRHAIPRNLRQGFYRGGQRRLDMYWRISAGIAGSPMPGSGPASPGAKGTLTEVEIWNLVDYVLSLPYEPTSRPQEAIVPKNQEAIF